MRNKQMDQLIDQMENYLECWKQFNGFVNTARSKKFSHEDDGQFLEIKSVIVQELELILASIEVSSPTKEEIHTLVGNAPSLRYLSELSEGALRNLESQWHKIYIGWHAILGQLKVRQRSEDSQSTFAAMFSRRKK
ncbi:conserved hypothetical protein [Verrucomicrobia bacterium]|nr:conserved hypothetical protein [Verrucomicrobiota bacterium]